MKISKGIISLFLLVFISCFSNKNISFSSKEVTHIGSSFDGKIYAIAYNTGEIKIKGEKNYNTNTKGFVRIVALRFIDENRFVFGDELGRFYLWDAKNKRSSIRLPKRIGKIKSISFSWDTSLKEPNNEIKLATEKIYIGGSRAIIAVSGNNFLKAIESKELNFSIENDDILVEEEGSRIHHLKNNTTYFLSEGHLKKNSSRMLDIDELRNVDVFSVSPDEANLVFSRKGKIYKTDPNIIKSEHECVALEHLAEVSDILFVNNTHIFTVSIDGIIKLWNVKKEQLIATFYYENYVIRDINYSNGKLFIANGGIAPLEIDPYLLILDDFNINDFTNSEHPKHRLSESKKDNGWRQILMAIKKPKNSKIHAFVDDFKIEKKEKYSVKRGKWVEIPQEKGPGKGFEIDDKTLRYRFQLFMDGEYNMRFSLGLDKLRIYKDKIGNIEINEDYFISKEIRFIIGKLGNKVYLLSIAPHVKGLNYNQNDASAFNNLLLTQRNVIVDYTKDKNKKPIRRSVRENNVIKAFNQKNVKTTKSDISSIITGMNTEILDTNSTFMLFISTHGRTSQGSFNLFLKLNDDNNEESEYNFRELIYKILEHVESKNICVIIDACYSGEGILALKDFFKEIEIGMKRKNQKMIILTSSGANQTSSESDSLKLGLFTSFLLEGGSGKADKVNKTKELIPRVTFGELFTYLSNALNEYQDEKKIEEEYQQKPIFLSFPQKGIGEKIPFLFLNQE